MRIGTCLITLSLALAAPASAFAQTPPAPPQVKPAPRSTAFKLGVAAVSVGGASLIVGVVTGIVAGSKDAYLDWRCPRVGHCFDSDKGDVDARRHFANASMATVIVGSALGLTGAILLATSGSRQKTSSGWVAPMIGAGSLGVQGGF